MNWGDMKILLFTHPRSGSNTLTAILNEHPEVNLMTEPFNEEREKWEEGNKNYKNETRTIADLDRVLEEIHQSYNGFKTLSYQLPEELTDYLLTKKGYEVIFLYRKNLLQTMVSAFIAEQTTAWSIEDKQKQEELKELKPLDIKKLEEQIDYLKEDTEHYRNTLQKENISFFEVAYEELFHIPIKEQMKKVEAIFTFLELDVPTDKREAIEKLLSPKRRMTNTDTYKLVPNIQEIEDKLGSPEFGFLFK